MLTRGHALQAFAAGAVALPLLWSGAVSAQGAAAGYRAAMESMNRDMAAQQMTGNADHNFASMMARPHQAAIDMARVEVEHGRDPETKRTAQEMIQKQQQDIAELRTWMSRHLAR